MKPSQQIIFPLTPLQITMFWITVVMFGAIIVGVYIFKQGFGGSALCFLETHDLVYLRLVYGVYMRLLKIKRRRDKRRHLEGSVCLTCV